MTFSLIHLLNSLETHDESHFAIFLKALHYAQKTKQSLPLDQYLLSIDQLFDNWKISKTDERRRQVYLLFASILKESGKHKEAYAIYRNYLHSLDKVDETTLSNTTDAVKEAIRVAYQFDDLLQIPAVAQLEKTNSKLYSLLKILSSGGYDEYKHFANSNDIEQITNSTANELESKMRLLTLCSLCLGATELSYATIAQELQIEEQSVEKWVIKAVAANLIDARLNQLEKKIFIK
jgi:translation initiation factor 3 subunit M